MSMNQNENRDFKYVLQDVSHVYIGAKMTYEDMLEWDDVPFKWKAVVNRFFLVTYGESETFPGTLCKLDNKDFLCSVLKQLKVKVKAGAYEECRGKRKYISRIYTAAEFHDKSVDKVLWEEIIPEEIIISKLALMTFSA